MLPPLAVSVAESPVQNAVGPEMVMGKAGLTVMVTEAEDEPQLLLTVTVYVPAEFTETDEVVAPLLQRKVLPPVAVSKEESPWQKDRFPFIPATGLDSTLTYTEAEDEPQLLKTVTV